MEAEKVIEEIKTNIKTEVETQVRSQVAEAMKAETAEIEKRAKVDFVGISPERERDLQWRNVGKAISGGGKGSLRALTQGGAGQINVVDDIVRAMIDGGKFLSRSTVLLGNDYQRIFPVLSPGLAVPAISSEGATGISADGTAALAGKNLQVYPYVSLVNVSRLSEMTTTIDSQLKAIFADAFSQGYDKYILTGNNTSGNFNGLFTVGATLSGGNLITAANGTSQTTSFKFSTVLNAVLALKVLNCPVENMAIIMHPNVMATLLGDTTVNANSFNLEYMARGTIGGIPVVLSSWATSTLTAGTVGIMLGNMKHYAVAMFNDLIIDRITVAGQESVAVQAIGYAQGSPLINTSFYAVKTAAS